MSYSYTVNGETYEGSRPYFGSSFTMPPFAFTTRVRAEIRLEALRPHSTVSVRYDPRRPWRSTLRAGTSWEVYLCIIFIVVVLGMLVGAVISTVQ